MFEFEMGNNNNNNRNLMKMMSSRRLARRFSVRMAKVAVGIAFGVLVLKWLFPLAQNVNEDILFHKMNGSLPSS
jgi:hypothetical protein